MSNHLAIATVTATLRQIVAEAITGVVAGAEVEHVSPDDKPPKPPNPGVNVFLYGVATNAARRNADLPSRRADGGVAQRPQAALDLHYLLSFYGDEKKLEPERLLGRVMAALHARPLLPRAKVQEVIAATGVLAGSDLDQAVESVRFSTIPLSLEEISKLWSVLFQTTYALSVAYEASAVMLEAEDETPGAALPVGSRGIHVFPFARPRVDRAVNAASPTLPIVPTSVLALEGAGLKGDDTVVRIGGADVTPSEVVDTRVSVPLGSVPAAALRAGIQGVQVVHRRAIGSPPTARPVEESNVAAFVLHPLIAADPADPSEPDLSLVPRVGSTPARITAVLTPPVDPQQRVSLLLNQLTSGTSPNAYVYAARPRSATTSSLDFDAPVLEPGTYLVRVQVDGAESLLTSDGAGAYTSPRLVVP